MEISFKIQGEVQVVEIDGSVTDSEAAAIRVKLEQKINQGRKKILFDVSLFQIENNAARNLLLGIVTYAMNRGTLVVLCGVKAVHRPLLLIPGNQQIKVFFTRAEGLDFIQKNVIPDPKASLAAPKKTEEEIKEDALKKLLEKYEVFQHNDDDDPFRLQFLIEQYHSRPNPEALAVEKRATESLLSCQRENRLMEEECDGLAKRVKSLMQYRKAPISGKELQLKRETMEKELREIKEAMEKLMKSVTENKLKGAEAKDLGEKTRKASLEALQEFENKIKSTVESQAKEAAELQRLDAEEQTNFDALLKKP